MVCFRDNFLAAVLDKPLAICRCWEWWVCCKICSDSWRHILPFYLPLQLHFHILPLIAMLIHAKTSSWLPPWFGSAIPWLQVPSKSPYSAPFTWVYQTFWPNSFLVGFPIWTCNWNASTHLNKLQNRHVIHMFLNFICLIADTRRIWSNHLAEFCAVKQSTKYLSSSRNSSGYLELWTYLSTTHMP